MFKIYSILAILLIPTENVIAGNSNELTLNLHDSVDVQLSHVYLKDLVKSVQGGDALYNLVKNIKLGEIGRVNQITKIHKDKIRYLVNKKINQNIRINSNPTIQVRQIFVPHSIDFISAEIANQLGNKLNETYPKSKIVSINRATEIKLPLGDVSYRYTFNNIKLAKRISVWLDIYVDDKHYQTLPLRYQLTVYGKAYVSNRRINKGETINPNDFILEERDLTIYRNPYESRDLNNRRLSKTILKGALLLSDQVEVLPVVYKGQKVKVISEYGNVVINTLGIAQQDGNKGSVVAISRNNSSEIFNGIVLKAGLVKAIGS